MKSFCIVHPKNLFVENKEALQDPNYKFIIGFQDVMKISKKAESKILVSNDLLAAFYNNLPWSDLDSIIFDKQMKESLLRQVLPFFSKNTEIDSDTSRLDPSDSDPDLIFFDEKSIEDTKRLITSTKEIKHSFFLCTDKVHYKFSYNGKKLNIKSISSTNEIYEQVDSFEELWPKSRSEFGKDLNNCVEIYMKKRGKKKGKSYSNKYNNKFTKDILGIDGSLQDLALEAITEINLSPTTPQGNTIKPLKNDKKGKWRYRNGDFRLIYLPDVKKGEILLISFGNRGSSYQ